MKLGAVVIQCLGSGRLYKQYLTSRRTMGASRVKLSKTRLTNWLVIRPEGMFKDKFVLRAANGQRHHGKFVAWSTSVIPKLKLKTKTYQPLEAVATNKSDEFFFRTKHNNEDYYVAAAFPNRIYLSIEAKSLFKVTWNSKDVEAILSDLN